MRDDDAAGLPFSATSGGVRLAVRLTPRAGRNGLDGIVAGPDGRPVLQMRGAAPPVEGAANAALVGFVAEAPRVRRADIAIVSGERGRLKLIELSGNAADLLVRLADGVGPKRPPP